MNSLLADEYRLEALRRVRLDARHGVYGDGAVPQWQLSMTCQETMLPAAEVLQAVREGQKLRASGVRCLCPRCGSAGEVINDRESLRQRYAAMRTTQLIARGFEPAERERIIAAEIDAGAAFQAQPVTVTRSKS